MKTERYCLKRKESKGAKIRKRYNQVTHLTKDTNGESKKKLTVRHHKRST